MQKMAKDIGHPAEYNFEHEAVELRPLRQQLKDAQSIMSVLEYLTDSLQMYLESMYTDINIMRQYSLPDVDLGFLDCITADTPTWRKKQILDACYAIMISIKHTRLERIRDIVKDIRSIRDRVGTLVDEIPHDAKMMAILEDDSNLKCEHFLCLEHLDKLETFLNCAKQFESKRRNDMESLTHKILVLSKLLNEESPYLSTSLLHSDAHEKLKSVYQEMVDRWQLVRQEKLGMLQSQLEDRIIKYRLSEETRSQIHSSLGDPEDPLYFENILSWLHKLDDAFADAADILAQIEARQAFIQKMVDFEKSASDPKRLFKSSFRLNEEEKFRKSSYPMLLQVESGLRMKILDWEQTKKKRFFKQLDLLSSDTVDQDKTPYLVELEMEISTRFVNKNVFEFFSTASRNYAGNKSKASDNRRVSAPVKLTKSASSLIIQTNHKENAAPRQQRH